MTHRSPLSLAFLCLCLASPAAAQEVYECSFPQKPDNLGYLAPTVIMAREPGSDSVNVVDQVIQQELGGPIEARIVEENDKKLSMAWDVKINSDGNTSLRVSYRFSIQKGSLQATLSAKPHGYGNHFLARGTCQRGQA